MKAKIIVGVVILLVIGVFVGNWIIGNKIAEEIDAELRDRISKMDLPLLLTYSEIDVNPLFSKVKVKTVAVANDSKTGKINCDALNIHISYSDALKISKGSEFEEINSFQITIVNPSFQEFSTNSEINFGNITLDFDGHITKRMFEDLEHKFPNEKQRLELSFSNMKVDLPEIYRELMLTSESRNKISKVDNANIILNYLPESKEFLIENLSISTPIISLKYLGCLEYNGNSPNDFKLNQLDVEANISLTPSNLKWGVPDETGRFSFSKLSSSIRTTLKSNKWGDIEEKIPEGEFSFLLEGLNAEFSGRLKRELEREDIGQILGISLDEIVIEKFSVSSKMENNHLTIMDTELITPLFSAILTADLLFDDEDPGRSIINNAKFIIKDLSSDLELTVAKLEKELRQSLPRVGNDIVLKFSGRLDKPKIEGLNL